VEVQITYPTTYSFLFPIEGLFTNNDDDDGDGDYDDEDEGAWFQACTLGA
jgi:hypothetical protein